MNDRSPESPGDDLIIERLSDGDGSVTPARLDPMDYTDLLRARGRRIEGYPHALGLDRDAALAAVRSLRAGGIAVARSEIVKIAFDLPEYVCEVQRFDRAVGEEYDQYCRRSLLELEEHIRGYADPGDGSVLYVLDLAAGDAGAARAA